MYYTIYWLQVYFIDYGGTANVSYNYIAAIDQSLLHYPALVVQCKLSKTTIDNLTEPWNKVKLCNTTWKIKVLEEEEDVKKGLVTVDLIDPKFNERFTGRINVVESLSVDTDEEVEPESVSEDHNASSAQPTVNEEQASDPATADVEHDNTPNTDPSMNEAQNTASIMEGELHKLPLETGNEVTVVWCVGPFEFYVIKQIDDYETQKEKMNAFYWDTDDEFMPMVGDSVAAYWPKYQEWYRCEVLNVTDDVITLLCVDYGCTYFCKPCNVRKLGDQFTELPPLAIKCCMFGLTEQEVMYYKVFEF